jgi:tripartite-type tricarboxylate transporter receptor subunit TctC
MTTIRVGTFLVLCVLATAMAQAQDYPKQPITLIVPFPEKSLGDNMARPIAIKLSAALAQPVNIQNVPGKSSSVGVAQAAKAAPDGYTLVFSGDAPLTTNFVVYESLGYDPRQDLAPIALLVATQNVIIVPSSSTAKSLDEVLKPAKEKPGQLSYAHAGFGLSSHVAGELMKKRAAADLKSTEAPVPELLKSVEEGQVLFGVVGVGAVVPRLKDGKLRAIAVTGPSRSSLLPDVPTLIELGHTGHDASAWFALSAPKGTPAPIIAKLNAEATKALNSPDLAAQLAGMGARPIPSSPGELGQRITTSIATLAELMKDVPKQK